MEHVKKHRRTIAWILMISFSMVMSLQAAPGVKFTNEKRENVFTSRSDEMGSFEKDDHSNGVQKKKKFPWLLVAGGAAVLGAAAYFLVFDKKKEEKTGIYTEITVGFNVLFQGNNQKSHYKVLVDSQTKIDEIFIFDSHFSNTYGDWKKFERNFWIKKDKLGDILVRVEAGDSYEKIFQDESCNFVSVVFNLEILSYKFSGGKDPGTPIISEKYFFLTAVPGGRTLEERIKEKIVTISAPPVVEETNIRNQQNLSLIKYINKEG